MMVMTAKVNIKKVLIALAAAAGILIALIALLGGGGSTQTAAPAVSDNDARVQFLKNFGWDVTNSPVESGQVRIPQEQSDIYSRYNALQKSQGYDLTQYAGKTVMRYVYKINNFPGATEPVYATLLVYKNQVIGGDVSNTSPGGTIQGFQMQKGTEVTQETVPEATATEATDPSADPAPTA